ncbi:MAG: DUF4199 domain-containing protein, partial [Ferruginibacter sp.]
MKNISAKYIGIITGIVMVIVSLFMFYQLHLPDTGTVKYICYFIYTVGIIFCLLNFKNKNSNNTFAQYFAEGFKTFVVVSLIMAIFTFVFYKINPQIFEKILLEINKFNATDVNKTQAEVLENGNKLRDIFVPMTVATN